jgi:regulator of nonsense transcripts 2
LSQALLNKCLFLKYEQLSHDSKHVNLPLAVSFIKYFGAEMLGTVGRKNHRDETSIASNENGEDAPPVVNGDKSSVNGEKDIINTGENPIVNESQRALFKSLLVGYFNGVDKHLIEDHQVPFVFKCIFLSYACINIWFRAK